MDENSGPFPLRLRSSMALARPRSWLAAAALALLAAELSPGDVVLVKASNAAGLGTLADRLAEQGNEQG